MSSLPVPPADAATAPFERPSRWARRKDDRPGELLDAALETFAERGYAASRLDDVARAAGVSKGTLYLYYASKEELFKAVVRSTIVAWLSDYQRTTASTQRPSRELLSDLMIGLWRHVLDQRLSAIVKLVVAEASNFPEVARFFHHEVVRPHVELIAGLIRRGIERGEFRPIDVDAAVHLWISPLVLKAIWKHSFDPVCDSIFETDPEQLAQAQVDLMLQTLATEGAQPSSRHPSLNTLNVDSHEDSHVAPHDAANLN